MTSQPLAASTPWKARSSTRVSLPPYQSSIPIRKTAFFSFLSPSFVVLFMCYHKTNQKIETFFFFLFFSLCSLLLFINQIQNTPFLCSSISSNTFSRYPFHISTPYSQSSMLFSISCLNCQSIITFFSYPHLFLAFLASHLEAH